MKLASRWNWLAVFVAVVGMVTVGAGLPGCSPQDKGTTDTDAAEGDTEEAVEEVVEEIDVAPPKPAEDATGPELDTPATDEAVEEETAETETTEPEVVDTEEVQMEAVEPEVADPEATEPEAAATEEEAAEEEVAETETTEEVVAEEAGTEETAEEETTEAAEEAPAAGDVDAKLSSYAPAADLVGQVEYYLERMGKSLEDEGEYEDNQDRISKDSNTLIVLALALGIHDEDSKYKKAAPAMLVAAQELSKTKDHAAAKAATEKLVAAAEGKDPIEGELKWENVVSLHYIKEQMSGINSNLKRYAKRKKFDNCAGYSALLAVIGQAIIANGDEVASPDQMDQWNTYCLQMRDAAAAVNKAMHAEDEEAAAAAMAEMAKRCDGCHEVFNPDDEEE